MQAATEKFECDGTDCVLGLMHETEEPENGDTKVCFKIELEQITDSKHTFKICHHEKPMQFSVAVCKKVSLINCFSLRFFFFFEF